MYYLHLEKFLNQPDADLKIMLAEASESLRNHLNLAEGAYNMKK